MGVVCYKCNSKQMEIVFATLFRIVTFASMKNRIEQVIEYFGMTPSQFADTIGVQRPTLHHILSGRNNASLDIVSRIRSAFPEVNVDWMISGEGEMLRNSSPTDQLPENNSDSSLFGDLFQSAENSKNQSSPKRARKKAIPEIPAELPTIPIVSQEPKEIAEVIVFYTDGSFSKISR